jgi:hypothetical protein
MQLCGRGRRAWFERHGLDYSHFVFNGLPIEQIEKIDDEFARRVVAFVKAESGANNEPAH